MNQDKEFKVEYWHINKITPYERNPRNNNDAVAKVAMSLEQYGWQQPIVVDVNGVIVAGHTRYKAAQKLNYIECPVVVAKDLSPEKIKAYRIADNKTGEIATWDMDLLNLEIKELMDLDFDIGLTGFELEDFNFDDEEIGEDKDADAIPEIDEEIEPITKTGDIWILGKHRVMCGDSTNIDDVARLMQGVKADMAFNDPPYGMKKENEGVENDNLNYDDLLEFNKKWIKIQWQQLKENGSWYCWGIDEPLMDIYSNIIKPLIKTQKATFRNLITWDKGNGQGQMAENFRMFAPADEKCLFVMCGVQGFNNNADNYFEGWDSVVNYLDTEKNKAKLTIKDCKKLAGHSEKSGCHWFDKSQWSIPTKDVYNSWKSYCQQNNIDAFKKEYDELKKEYDELKKEYDELKKEYYATRAYFNNTHDNMNNVWHFERTGNHEKSSTGGHATPKPIILCERAIKSSCKENGLMVDYFLGSGSTLIACEKTKRVCYGVEISPKYCDVIVKRWEDFTGKKAVRESENE